MPARSTAPLLADPIKCRWCTFTIRRFQRRPDSRITSAWHLLLDHMFDAHTEQAMRFADVPDSVNADVFEWSR